MLLAASVSNQERETDLVMNLLKYCEVTRSFSESGPPDPIPVDDGVYVGEYVAVFGERTKPNYYGDNVTIFRTDDDYYCFGRRTGTMMKEDYDPAKLEYNIIDASYTYHSIDQNSVGIIKSIGANHYALFAVNHAKVYFRTNFSTDVQVSCDSFLSGSNGNILPIFQIIIDNGNSSIYSVLNPHNVFGGSNTTSDTISGVLTAGDWNNEENFPGHRYGIKAIVGLPTDFTQVSYGEYVGTVTLTVSYTNN